jgi:aryl-alcohol dehydrogenase-like predicted oxidoreductase
MRYTLLGASGLRVSEACLGAMTFGTDWGWGADEQESRQQFDTFAEAGGTFIDTSNQYTNGTSERLVGEFVKADRDHFVIGTKYSLSTRQGDLNAGGNHRKNLVHSIDGSLRRLGTDYIDLLWLHAWDYVTPAEEVMRALDDQVRAGKVLYIGISDTPAWVISRMNTLAELRGWTSFAGLQIRYSLAHRDVERELVPMARGLGLGVTAWGPLGSGLLSGKYDRRNPGRGEGTDSRRLQEVSERDLAIAEAVSDVADKLGLSSASVALAWLRYRGAIPIIGARTHSQLQDNLGFIGLTLPEEAITELETASEVPPGFPHDLLASADFVFGGLRDSLDLPRGHGSVRWTPELAPAGAS